MKLVRSIIKLTYSSFVLILFSCSEENKDYQTDLINCINEKVEKKLNSQINFFKESNEIFSEIDLNIFDSISKFENSLIDSKILPNKSQNGYKILLKELNNKEEFKARIKNQKIDDHFIRFLNSDDLITLIIYDSCPMEILLKNADNKEIVELKLKFEKVIAKAFTSKTILDELIDLEFFTDDYVRLSTCYLIYINSYRGEEPEIVDDKELI
ncbi:hypothetical protein [Mangrovimonas futianensis]|uniref:hypothetical protein n=1 Tax=Mangrovimonas futianensis TaxID=2895523 RepID=UPI001E4B0FBD|nr:hypothetical protein [Mangrovimonas futianensis]MCF1420864.1 hypothetical protein [Mangrovimonas futianensis]